MAVSSGLYISNDIRDFGGREAPPPSLGGIYRLPIAAEILSDIQIKHKHCQPSYFAIDL
jgi:hypothetical protein